MRWKVKITTEMWVYGNITTVPDSQIIYMIRLLSRSYYLTIHYCKNVRESTVFTAFVALNWVIRMLMRSR